MARARRRVEEADLTLWLSVTGEPMAAPFAGTTPAIPVVTKADLWPDCGTGPNSAGAPIRISAMTGAGIAQLLDAVADLAEERMAGPAPALITAERHRAAFADALGALERALDPLRRNWS